MARPKNARNLRQDASSTAPADQAHISADNARTNHTSLNSAATSDNDALKKSITYPIHISISKWLVLSSCFFLIPALHAFTSSYHYYGALSTITTIASINHWRRAEFGARRNVDRAVAHTSFIAYFLTGCNRMILRSSNLLIYAVPGVIFILTFYYLSIRLMDLGSTRWVYCHFLFHVFVAIEQILVLQSLKE